MRTLSIGHLGLSLIGCFALVQALVLFPSLATWGLGLLRSDQSPVLILLVTIIPFALLILFGVVLVTNPDRIARFLWAGDSEGATVSEDLAQVVFAATGVLIFAEAIPSLFYGAAIALSGSQDVRFQTLAGALARALLGVVLFLRPKAVVEFWRRKQPGRHAESNADGAA
jgi:hypothetical protein